MCELNFELVHVESELSQHCVTRSDNEIVSLNWLKYYPPKYTAFHNIIIFHCLLKISNSA